MVDKLSKAEKMLAKGMINLYIEKGWDLDSIKGERLEVDIMKITGNNYGAHRYMVEDYINLQIKKMK